MSSEGVTRRMKFQNNYSLIKALKVEKNEMYYAFFRACFVSSMLYKRGILHIYPVFRLIFV